jgi:hypothetical protein
VTERAPATLRERKTSAQPGTSAGRAPDEPDGGQENPGLNNGEQVVDEQKPPEPAHLLATGKAGMAPAYSRKDKEPSVEKKPSSKPTKVEILEAVELVRQLRSDLETGPLDRLWWRQLVVFVRAAETVADTPELELGQPGFIWSQDDLPPERTGRARLVFASLRWFVRDTLPTRVPHPRGDFILESHDLLKARQGLFTDRKRSAF